MKHRLRRLAGLAFMLAVVLAVFASVFLRPRLLTRGKAKPIPPTAWKVEAFDASPGPKLPKGWKHKFWKGHEIASVVEREQGNGCVRLSSDSSSTALYREWPFRAQQFPYLNWSWMAMKLPEGADARFRGKVDQAAQIYVLFFKGPNPLSARALGYVWATETPKELKIISPKWHLVRYVVLRNHQDPTGVWFQEKRNILEDYRALYGGDPPKANGIAIQIDSDDTKTKAESYFDDIFLSKE